jgi:phage I-like protein
MNHIRLFSELSGPEIERPEGAPARLRIPLLPEGVFEHEWYGILRWTPEKFAQMRENFEKGVTGWQPMLNFDHASVNWAAATNPAAGWIVELIPVEGVGLDAVVELTDLGLEAVENRRYRYISAEVYDAYTDSRGETTANVIGGAALTNLPFHDTMRGIFEGQPQAACFSNPAGRSLWVASDPRKESDMSKLMDAVRRKFGLPANATEEQAAQAIEAAPSDTVQLEAVVADVVPGPIAITLADGTVVTPAQAAERLNALAREAEEQRQAAARTAAEQAVEGHITAGRILPAQRETAVDLALKDQALFERLFGAAQPQVDLGQHGFQEHGTADGETTFTAAVAAKVAASGMDYQTASDAVAQERPELYEAHRRAMTGRK